MHLSRLFQRSVRQYGDLPALTRGTEVPLTYRQLDARVRALAHWFRSDLGLNPGDRVVLAMPNSTTYAETMLALWHARLCAVPAHGKLHAAEIAHVLADSGARACLSAGPAYDMLVQHGATLPVVMLVDVEGAAWVEAAGRDGVPDAGPAPVAGDEEAAWLFYTSGTTGKPKGVQLSHANLVAMALNFHADLLAIDSRDVLVHLAPMSHGSGLYGLPYWMRGALQVVPASGGFDEAELVGLLDHHRSASFFASPTMISRLVRLAPAAPGLRCIFAGGAPFYVEDIKSAVACLGPRVAQMYGQGESPMTISGLTAEAIGRAVADGDDAMLASVGYTMSSVDVDITDEEGRVLPQGEIGEVTVRSPTVMRGYWGLPAATAATLVYGALRTGDIGLIDERGLLHLRDRSKDLIISGGSNIYPREVEEALLRHPAVQEVAVVGTPDAEWGEAVVAFVVSRDGAAPGPDELDATCLEVMARFKRPKRYVFVDAIEKNATGKVLKTELRKLAQKSATAHS